MTAIVSPVLTKLAEDSLLKAAEAFGFMVGQKMEIEEVTIVEGEVINGKFNLMSDTEYLLTTEIIGDLNGKSYLIFNTEVAEKIFKILTGSPLGSSSLGVDAVLKEIDNIVSASMISILADQLKNTVYGDVPYFFEHNKSQVEKLVKEDYKKYMSQRDQVLIQCKVRSANSELYADFIWIISGEIVNNLVD